MNIAIALASNHLLAALPEAVFQRLLPHLELVSMPLGKILSEPDELMMYAYFPTTAIIALIYNMENGAPTSIAMVGNEGMLGISLFMSGETTQNTAIVQCEGLAYRIRGHQMMLEYARAGGRRFGAFQDLLLRYTQALFAQMSQTSVCNRHHSIQQQLCRWLLLTADRIEGNDLYMTQELISNMLGVRREGVTEAAGELQRLGIIIYKRGHIQIVNRVGLESLACECYQVVKHEFERLLPSPSLWGNPSASPHISTTKRSLHNGHHHDAGGSTA